MSGQAASYYDPNQGFDAQGQGQTKPNGNNEFNDQRGNGYQPPQSVPEAKPAVPPPYPDNPPPYSTFDEAFKIERPKWNDLWAGLLVSDCPLGNRVPEANSSFSVNRCLSGLCCSVGFDHSFVCNQQEFQRRWDLRLLERFLA